MNKHKRYITILGAIALIITGITSCSKDFLNEELKTKRNYDYYSTPEGINDAIIALYNYYRYPFNFEQGYATTSYGTDEFTVGGDNSNHDWNDYTANLSPSVVAININTISTAALWDNMYLAISIANIVLAKADGAITDTALRKVYKAEASFARAYSYFKLVQQYGGVVLKLQPSEVVERYFVRASKEECVNQIINDFKAAYAGLPPDEPKEGKLYKDVAAHFLAKALLYRASEINNDWNASYKTEDLAECITLADEVITNHSLANDFRDIFSFTKSDDANESLDEIIFAAQFSGANTAVEGNRMHLYFVSQYNNLTGFTRDIAGGREYQRLRPSNFIYDVFDLEKDSRFWKCFRTKQNLNNAATTNQLLGLDTISGLKYSYNRGDLGIIYIINQKSDTRFDTLRAKLITDTVTLTSGKLQFSSTHSGLFYLNPYTGKPTPHTYVRYMSNGAENLLGTKGSFTAGKNRFPSLNKWLDGSRPTHNYETGRRDGILARVGETYLIKAEALIRQEKYDEAISTINILRARAAFKGGEDRAAYTDGGAAYINNAAGQATYGDGVLRDSHANTNSYYESLNIPNSTDATDLTSGITPSNLPVVDEAIIAKLGYTSTFDRMMCFLLNERTRELVGEFHRWEDLARTQTLIKRAKTFNPEAASNLVPKHYVRPIPQTFLDAIYTADGIALTPSEKKAMQNPDY